MEYSKTNEPYKFVLDLLQNLRRSNKRFTLQNLHTNYTWKNIRQQCKSKTKIIAQQEMMSLNYLMVFIQCQIFKIILSIF